MLKLLNYYKYLFILSGVIMVLGIASLAIYRLNLGVDFKGGTITELEFSQTPDQDKVRSVIESTDVKNFQIQTAGDSSLLIKTEALPKEKHDQILEKLRQELPQFEEKRFESIGPVIGQELKRKALYQLGLVGLGIVIYIAYAFRKVARPITSWQFGWAAIIALIHDLLIVLGIFSILGHYRGIEIDSLFVTAMLTVLGFSVHDTIVVFDRIRENLRLHSSQPLDFVINHSISQTIVRSLNTSLTVLLVLLALLLFGGESIRYFVLALLIGVITGTYSSIFVASPILVIWQRWRMRKS